MKTKDSKATKHWYVGHNTLVNMVLMFKEKAIESSWYSEFL